MALSASNSVGSSILRQVQLQQAQRNAEQARVRAESLQAQASDAQRAADSAQSRATSLRGEANQAQADAGRAALGVAAVQTWGETKTQLNSAYTGIVKAQQAQQVAEPRAQAQAQAPQPVVNAQGEMTGTQLNLTA